MQTRRAVGRDGASRKYDLLTVLGAYALSQDKGLQRRTLRLICLITARYNWQADHLSVGQAEIARLWSVDLRTVKREMAALRDRGWLVEKRQAARGRVAVHGLDIDRILQDTRPVWDRIGPDLAERLAPSSVPGPEAMADRVVIPFPPPAIDSPASVWGRVATRLAAEDPAVFRAWLAPLQVVSEQPDLILRAPSGFHATYLRTHLSARIEAALRLVAPGLRLRMV
jgi:hypothetical protein